MQLRRSRVLKLPISYLICSTQPACWHTASLGASAGWDVAISGQFFSHFGRWSDSCAFSQSLWFRQKRANERMHPASFVVCTGAPLSVCEYADRRCIDLWFPTSGLLLSSNLAWIRTSVAASNCQLRAVLHIYCHTNTLWLNVGHGCQDS